MSQKTAFAEVQSITLGADKITAIPDGGAYIIATTMYPPSASEKWAKHKDLTDEEQRVIVTLGGFLIETGDRKILMDLGYGPQVVDFPGFGPFIGGSYLENLKKAGVTPEDITDVIYTHLHCDHVGWTSVEKEGKRTLTFPNATYWCSRTEWEFWVKNPGGLGPDQTAVLDPLKDVIRFVEDGSELAPRLTTHLAPGHTPGMTILRLNTGEKTLWFTGDIFHSTVQFRERDWYAVFDVDHELAAKTRAKYLSEFIRDDTVLADCHFSNVVFGALHAAGDRLNWVPVIQ